ncbi:OmpA family protein [Sansalvadorimonas verongulae]|uniref:OmpA family protein n=1 Tax=Sansalvadorimonas verongulae TaxID=2172824 RepID=UPI0018AD118C|nr:OmpA family protein [Sansalvadorimonas verongulae]
MVSSIKRSFVFYLGLFCISLSTLLTGCRDDNTKPSDEAPVLEEDVVVVEPITSKEPSQETSVPIPVADASHEEEIEKIIQDEGVTFEDVDTVFHFGFDKDTLAEDAMNELLSLIPALQSMPGVIVIEGHTDARGPIGYNKLLGMRRAQAVAKVLIDNDIDKKRLKLTSYGSEHPLARGDDEASYAENRRVELFVNASNSDDKS